MKSINCQGELLSFDTPKVMGILNVTPDSFFAQSRVQGTEILAKAEQMLTLGATFVDIGGYSSRPNAAEVSAEEELQRVVPVVEALEVEKLIKAGTPQKEALNTFMQRVLGAIDK